MALNDYTYSTTARVQALVGDLAESRTFSTTTAPTLAEVETMQDDVASEIHAALAKEGYPVNTSSAVSTAAPRVHAFLRTINTYGAAALILMTMPSESTSPEAEESSTSRANVYRKRYTDGLKQIAGPTIERLGLARTTTRTTNFRAVQRLNSDGDVKAPFFKRGQHDIAGSRELTEDT